MKTLDLLLLNHASNSTLNRMDSFHWEKQDYQESL